MKPIFARPSPRRGMTLIELLIASSITLMILSVVYMYFKLGKVAYDYSEYSYALSRDAYVSLRWIMRDLRETSLTTLRVFDENPREESPVMVFQAASQLGENKLEISNFGSPLWQKHVVYTLMPDKRSSDQLGFNVASLKRYEIPGDENLSPFPVALELPGSPDNPVLPQNLEPPRVVLRNIVYKEQNLGISKKEDEEYKGFRVSFVRRSMNGDGFSDDEYSDVNPALADDITGNTKLVNVEFTILEVSNTTGGKNILGLSFRVNPRH